MPFKATRIDEKYFWLTHTRQGQRAFYGTTIVIAIADWENVKEIVAKAIVGPVVTPSDALESDED